MTHKPSRGGNPRNTGQFSEDKDRREELSIEDAVGDLQDEQRLSEAGREVNDVATLVDRTRLSRYQLVEPGEVVRSDDGEPF